MILVAVVAIGIWAATTVPQMIDQAFAYHVTAEYEAYLERTARAMERENSTRASDIQSQFDEWRRNTESADEMTERYFTSRRDFYAADAEYQQAMAAYHAGLKTKYRWAKWFPLVSAERNPAPPPDPIQPAPPDPEPGKVYERISEGGISAAFSPGGPGLAVGCRDKTIKLLELPSRIVLASFSLPEGDAHSLDFSPDGETLFAAAGGLLVRQFDVATGRAGQPIPWIGRPPGSASALSYVSAVRCSPDGGTIAVAAGGFQGVASRSSEIFAIRLFDTKTSQLKWEHNRTGHWPISMAFSPDGETVAFGSNAAVLLDARYGTLKAMLQPVSGSVLGVAFAPDGRTLACADYDVGLGSSGGNARIALWDAATSRLLRTLEGSAVSVGEVAFSPDGRTLVAGGSGPSRNGKNPYSGSRALRNTSEVRAWHAATGMLIWTTEGESNSAYSLSFSPDGKSLAFCDEDCVYTIDVGTGKLKQIVRETTSRFRARDRLPAKTEAVRIAH